jgi:hypothetical protein
VLPQLQGRIFALLYLRARSLALEDLALELQQRRATSRSTSADSSTGIGCAGRRSAARARIHEAATAIGAVTQGKPVDGETLRNAVPLAAPAGKRR